jgi:hypothetical protein
MWKHPTRSDFQVHLNTKSYLKGLEKGEELLTMEINDYFQSMILCPIYSFGQVRQLALNIRFSGRDIKCPISDWKPYMIQPTIPLKPIG